MASDRRTGGRPEDHPDQPRAAFSRRAGWKPLTHGGMPLVGVSGHGRALCLQVGPLRGSFLEEPKITCVCELLEEETCLHAQVFEVLGLEVPVAVDSVDYEC